MVIKMIKNIIFDVGDVLLGYRWKEMLLEHGIQEERAEVMGQAVFNHPLWKELDLGNVTMEEFMATIGEELPEYKEDLIWFLNHTELMPVMRPKVWEKIPILKERGYKIYILSNYSKDLFKTHTKDTDFLHLVDGKVVSYEIHKIKPDKAIYEYLLQKYQLNATDCIFFDDRKENVEGAINLGIKGIQVISEEQLISELEKIC